MRNKRVCDYIAEAIQNEILSGRMSSGVPLRQEELADSLGYSRIPIREALQILESQGLAKRLATIQAEVYNVYQHGIFKSFT
jgi:DNA-binding GntR family transcriptional regulator